MCMVFRMEDLVASAFIGLLRKGGGNSNLKISVRQLVKYKYNVLNALDRENKTAVIPISRDYTERFLCTFGDYFSYEEDKKTVDYICLNNGKTENDLKNKFIVYIPGNVRNYFEDERNLKPILSGT